MNRWSLPDTVQGFAGQRSASSPDLHGKPPRRLFSLCLSSVCPHIWISSNICSLPFFQRVHYLHLDLCSIFRCLHHLLFFYFLKFFFYIMSVSKRDRERLLHPLRITPAFITLVNLLLDCCVIHNLLLLLTTGSCFHHSTRPHVKLLKCYT